MFTLEVRSFIFLSLSLWCALNPDTHRYFVCLYVRGCVRAGLEIDSTNKLGMSESFCVCFSFSFSFSASMFCVLFNIHLQCEQNSHKTLHPKTYILYTTNYSTKRERCQQMEPTQKKEPKLKCNAMRRFTKCVSNSYRIFIKKIKVGKKREECFAE